MQGRLYAMDSHAKRLRPLARAAKRSNLGSILVIAPGSVQETAAGHIQLQGFQDLYGAASTISAAAPQTDSEVEARQEGEPANMARRAGSREGQGSTASFRKDGDSLRMGGGEVGSDTADSEDDLGLEAFTAKGKAS